jgi:hypothetical protein
MDGVLDYVPCRGARYGSIQLSGRKASEDCVYAGGWMGGDRCPWTYIVEVYDPRKGASSLAVGGEYSEEVD